MKKIYLIETKDNLIYWSNSSGKITEKEALEVAEKIKSLVDSGKYNRMIIDNSNLKGVWNSDVDKIWIDLMMYVSTYIPKTATLCENIVNKLQTNYLASQTTNPKKLKAFTIFEKEEFNHYIYSDD